MPAGQDRRPHTLRDIARAVEGQLIGSPDLAVTGVSSLAEAREGDLSYIEHDRYLPAAAQSRAVAFVVSRELVGLTRPQIVASDAKYAFARIVQQFFTAPYMARAVAADVARGQDVQVGADVSIWPFVTLGDRVRIGARVTLYPGCLSVMTRSSATIRSCIPTSPSGNSARSASASPSIAVRSSGATVSATCNTAGAITRSPRSARGHRR